jgi:hypothetical protein
MNVLEATQR